MRVHASVNLSRISPHGVSLLAATLTSIKATPTLCNNFDDTVDIPCQVVLSSKNNPSEPRRISVFEQARDKKHPRSVNKSQKGKRQDKKKCIGSKTIPE